MLFDSILALRAAGHEIVLIGTCAAAPEYDITERDFRSLARKIGCPFFNDIRIQSKNCMDLITLSKAEVAISMNWMTLIPNAVIEKFGFGIINAHAGDLPRYRGNACPNWAILAGESSVVLTLHYMTPELDAGPILLQRPFPIDGQTYIGDVYRFLERTLPEMYVEVIEGLAKGKMVPREQPQDPALSLRCFPRIPQDSELFWSHSAEDLARLVRASAAPFAGAYTYLNGQKLTVWRAHAGSLPYPYLGANGQVAEVCAVTGYVSVICGSGILTLEEVGLEDGQRVAGAAIVRSVRMRLGRDAMLGPTATQPRIRPTKPGAARKK